MFKKIAAAGSSLVALSSMAAVPQGVTTALSDAGTDSVTVAVAAFAIILGIVAFKYFRKAL